MPAGGPREHARSWAIKEQILADRSGFILARGITGADVSDVEGALPVLETLTVRITSLTADTGYRAGKLRRLLRQRSIRAFIPLGCNQDAGVPAGFVDHYDHLVCPLGKRLLPAGPPDAEGSIRYRARAADCRECPLRQTCVSASRRAKALWASTYRLELRQAERTNQTARYHREQRRRQTVSEGVFAHLDQVGGRDAHVRGLERVNRRNTILAIAHNIGIAMIKRRFWPREAGAGPRAASLPSHTGLLRRQTTPTKGAAPPPASRWRAALCRSS